MTPIEYAASGRMKYHPDYHPRQGKPWTNHEQRYVIERYVKDGPEEVSFALGRTIGTVMSYVYRLRRLGVMAPAPATGRRHKKRIRP